MSDPNEISLDFEEDQIDQNNPQDAENAEMAKLMGFSSFTTTARTRRPRPSSISDERPPCKKSRSDEGPTVPQVSDGIHPTAPQVAHPRVSCSSIIVTTDIDVDISPSPKDQQQNPFAIGVESPTITAIRVNHDEDASDAAADDDTASPNQGQQPGSRDNNPSARGAPNSRGRGNFGERGGRGGARGGRGGVHNPNWYLGYYDSRSNENPWELLEKKNGLEPVGTWLERKPYQPRGEHQQQPQEQDHQQPDQQLENTENDNGGEGSGFPPVGYRSGWAPSLHLETSPQRDLTGSSQTHPVPVSPRLLNAPPKRQNGGDPSPSQSPPQLSPQPTPPRPVQSPHVGNAG
ncbi:hypothetical protein B0T21DRAFT_432773 [Apiosordaria backusii]|uniref:Uncharacterized protein n=1 Tax=Apiosordaria backusii TaxID=314023 RepID=A0AA40ELQ1_9PEZI|nr:hypothetical protein B0T21DRAFT_432773 [Apiosordaria backusii]